MLTIATMLIVSWFSLLFNRLLFFEIERCSINFIYWHYADTHTDTRALVVTGTWSCEHITPVLQKLHWLPGAVCM